MQKKHESTGIQTFKDLRIWQKGLQIVQKTYKSTSNYPKYELYGLASQMRRSAVSIPSNIAEGFRRFYPKENIQFLRISLGSCAELETQVIISVDLEFLDSKTGTEFSADLEHLSRMITVSIKKLKQYANSTQHTTS